MALSFTLQRLWLLAIIFAALSVAWAVYLWRRRKGRKRARRELGAKSRALIAALVAALREGLQPRPVLRPQPGGVR